MSFLKRFFYESLLQPDDDFTTRCRKFILAAAAVLDVFYLYFISSNIVWMYNNPIVTHMITNQIATIGLSIVFLFCWLYAKRTLTVPDALMDAWLFGVNLSIILTVVGSTGYPWVPHFQTMAIVSLLCNTPWLRYHVALSVVGMFLVQFNQATEPFGYLLLILPGDRYAVTFTTTITRHLSGSLAFALSVFAVSTISNEFNRISKSASKGLRMAQAVSDKLIAYDTDGAKAILALIDQGDGGGTVDPELFAAFAQITANLVKYRDFLPEALLQPPEEDDADSMDLVNIFFPPPPLRFETELQHRKISVMRLVFPTSQVLAQTNPVAAHSFSVVLLRIVARCVTDHGGLCMSLTPSNIVACWNGHKSCHNHEQNAVKCALEIAASLDGEQIFENVPWTVFIAGGNGVVGMAGSDHQKATVILGVVPHLIDLMSHLARLYPHTIVITDKVRDASRVTFVSRIVDVLSVDDTSTYIYEVLGAGDAIGDLISYNEAFSALQSGHCDEASAKFLKHIRACGRSDPQALRLYRISCHLASGHAWHPRKFAGWTSFEEPSLNVPVPDDVPQTASPKFIAPPPSNVDSILRNEISLSSRLPGRGGPAVIPATFVDHMNRHWRRSAKILGEGGNAQVWLGLSDDGALVALKTVIMPRGDLMAPRPAKPGVSVRSTHDVLQDVLREVSLLSNLRDENIVGYVGSAVVRGVLIIIMEYVPGGSLSSLLHDFTSLDVGPVQRYVRDIVRGLSFLHRSDVIHQDVKPGNVLLMTDGQCKLGDFGASAKLEELRESGNKLEGTAVYMAPEQCIGKVCKASDVWSVGVLTYQLLTGQFPYPKSVLRLNPYDMIKAFRTISPQLTLPLPPTARSFCEAILQRDPTKRPTADELLHDPFLLS